MPMWLQFKDGEKKWGNNGNNLMFVRVGCVFGVWTHTKSVWKHNKKRNGAINF